jgi:hypothetical protein
MRVFDVGYLASELRGTITVDSVNQDGLPTLRENFFEFAERGEWEDGVRNFVDLADLRDNAEYYLFVTTPSGLYRYDMNDIVRVTGRLANTPLIRFVQKGRGVTSITGEKLYESQVLAAMEETEGATGLRPRFWQAVADEEDARYDLYVEAEGEADTAVFAGLLDGALRERNMEYAAKRASGRLRPLRVHRLRPGTAEAYKAHYLAAGQREGQFKPAVLQYRKNLTFAIRDWVDA